MTIALLLVAFRCWTHVRFVAGVDLGADPRLIDLDLTVEPPASFPSASRA